MGRLCSILLLFAALVAVPAAVSAQEQLGEGTITEGLRDKGVDWLKDKAKDAGEDWVFDTGQSETMHEILLQARERADGEGNDKKALCQYAVMSEASAILNDINTNYTIKSAGRLAFDTVTKMAGLAAGLGGAAAEGGAIDWLVGQYADAAKGQAKDSTFDALRKLFGLDKEPEYELYETSGKKGDCDYTLRAMWDIAGGTYRVYIFGNCHCAKVGQFGLEPTALGKWWISFEGHLRLQVNKEKRTASWVVLPARMDFDAQCACSTRELRTAFAPKKKETFVAPGTGTGTQPPSGGSTTTPVTPPGPPVPVCKECQSIQDKIDADKAALADDEVQVSTLTAQLTSAKATLGSAKGKLEDIKASPQDFTITPEQAQQQVNDAQAQVDRINRESARLEADQVRLKNELKGLAKQLEECIKNHCGEGHASVSLPVKEQYAVATRPGRNCEQVQPTSFASAVLAVHNSERAAAGAQPLCWNGELAQHAAEYAQQLARTGELVHAPRQGRGVERENLSEGNSWWTTGQMLNNWVREKRNFHAGIFPNVCTGDWSQCAHYTQMIWPTTTDVGCGEASGSGHKWLVCRYSPGGNRDGQPVGERGAAERGL